MDVRGAPREPEHERWMGLHWSAWMPLMAAHPLALAQLPSFPGVYRVRRAGSRHELLWIGWADEGVRQTVERLARQVYLPVEPYDDPQHPARRLWLARRLGTGFEVSGVALPERDGERTERELRAAYRTYTEGRLPDR
jgi:hypothetical protein